MFFFFFGGDDKLLWLYFKSFKNGDVRKFNMGQCLIGMRCRLTEKECIIACPTCPNLQGNDKDCELCESNV